jgi:hypothetical protein
VPATNLLLQCSVWPYFHQVELGDPLVADYPQWQTGEEPAVAIETSVAVATRPDSQGGVVELEVWSGPAEPLPVLRWDGHIVRQGEKAVVGNTEGDDLHAVAPPRASG